MLASSERSEAEAQNRPEGLGRDPERLKGRIRFGNRQKGVPFMFGIGGYEPIFFQIALAFLHEFLMRRIRAYTWAKRLGRWRLSASAMFPRKNGHARQTSGLMAWTVQLCPARKKIQLPSSPVRTCHFPFRKNAISIKESLFFEISGLHKGVSDPWGSGQCRLPLRNIDRTSGSQRQFSS